MTVSKPSSPSDNPAPIEPAAISLLWAGPESAGDVAKMHRETQDTGWSDDTVQDFLTSATSSALIAKVRLRETSPPASVGFIIGQIAADEVEILSLGVLEPFRRFGVGRTLVEGLMRSAKRAEAAKMYLEVAVDNEQAIALYGKLGFTEAGHRNGYYKKTDGRTVDALIMTRDL